MPYNTRRKSLSLPSLGIHVPMTAAARAAHNASTKSARLSNSSTASTSPRKSSSRSRSPDSHPSKRLKQSHSGDVDPVAIESTPPPSPTPATSVDMEDAELPKKIDLEGINDDIVEAVITQLQNTGNRPHLIRDLATVLALSLRSVQKYVIPFAIDFLQHDANHHSSANAPAIISSRLVSYMKRPCWTALAPCPLAKELEDVHPRRTYYFLTTQARQPLPESGSLQPIMPRLADITPSVSLTDDSGSDELEERRRQLSPSPEIDLPRYDFNGLDEMPMTPMGSLPKPLARGIGDLPHDLPPLETDEREFSQTADTLLKRKFNEAPEEDRLPAEYGMRDDMWFGDNATAAFLTSPAMRPSITSNNRKEDEAENWIKLNKLFEWDQSAGAEGIEIDELDGLMEGC